MLKVKDVLKVAKSHMQIGICGLLLFLVFGNDLFAANFVHDTAFKTVKLTTKQIIALRKEVQKKESRYDRNAHMLSSSFGSPGYHTTLKGGVVHSTFSSLGYALELFDTNIDSLANRASLIIDTIVALQDKNIYSKNFGLWPWFLEEPLEKMSPPDANWADFCSKRLLEIIINHRNKIPDIVASKIDSAIIFAARAIQQRNVAPSYTNMAVMGAFVTIVAGDYYKIPAIYEYGIQRLKRFYNYTETEGGFTEYNSPTYNMVVIEELNRLRFYVRDNDTKLLVNNLYGKLWCEIALHFHVPTQQWSGPHSRCYNNFLSSSALAVIKNALAKEKDRIFLIEDYRYSNSIPDSLKYYFTSAKNTKYIIDTFKVNKPTFIGTTYLTPDYVIGSINQCDMWNQRRNLIAYWGNAPQVSVMNVRLLHDFYDFASGIFKSVQFENKILAGISFITDGGNTHPSLDKVKNSTILAKDIRLRFEFNGYGLSDFKLKKLGEFSDYTTVEMNGINISLIVPYAVFDNNTILWDYGTSKNSAWIDVVFYKGENIEINLAQIEKAAAVIALSISKKLETNLPELSLKNITSDILVQWGHMQITTPVKPYKSK